MMALLIFFSTILYHYINYSVDKELKNSLIKHAKYIFATYPDVNKAIRDNGKVLEETLHINVEMVSVDKTKYRDKEIYIKKIQRDKEYFFELYFPYKLENSSYLIISTNITKQKNIQKQVYKAIIFINLLTMVLIIFYAYFLSGMLINPIKILSKRLSKCNEKMIEPINTENLPKEFETLAISLNTLMMRIQNFVKYKKELFVGTAHELKTPLAVMKTKTQVTLMKRDRNVKALEDALKQNIISIDEMNKIISSILEFGRAEGAQFETPVDLDIIEFINNKAKDFRILAEANGQNFVYDIQPDSLIKHIQPMLLTQIIQNFVQNALKFTPNGKEVMLRSYEDGNMFIIEVIDEGSGIDENRDLFAPFIRGKTSTGTGLGLFLAKSASDAMGATISLSNRENKDGTIARVVLPK
jgi:two-component system OmpR family sensor kinase